MTEQEDLYFKGLAEDEAEARTPLFIGFLAEALSDDPGESEKTLKAFVIDNIAQHLKDEYEDQIAITATREETEAKETMSEEQYDEMLMRGDI